MIRFVTTTILAAALLLSGCKSSTPTVVYPEPHQLTAAEIAAEQARFDEEKKRDEAKAKQEAAEQKLADEETSYADLKEQEDLPRQKNAGRPDFLVQYSKLATDYPKAIPDVVRLANKGLRSDRTGKYPDAEDIAISVLPVYVAHPRNPSLTTTMKALFSAVQQNLRHTKYNPDRRYTSEKQMPNADNCSREDAEGRLALLQKMAHALGTDEKKWTVAYGDYLRMDTAYDSCDGQPDEVSPRTAEAYQMYMSVSDVGDAHIAARAEAQEHLHLFVSGWYSTAHACVLYKGSEDEIAAAKEWLGKAGYTQQQIQKAVAVKPEPRTEDDGHCVHMDD